MMLLTKYLIKWKSIGRIGKEFRYWFNLKSSRIRYKQTEVVRVKCPLKIDQNKNKQKQKTKQKQEKKANTNFFKSRSIIMLCQENFVDGSFKATMATVMSLLY